MKNNLKDYLIGKALTSIQVLQVNDHFLEVLEGRQWLFDGLIKLSFGIEALTIYWNLEHEGFTYADVEQEDNPLKDLPFFDIQIQKAPEINNLFGQVVKETEVVWETYDIYDANGQAMQQGRTPVNITLHFSTGSKLQIACIDCDVDVSNHRITKATYSLFDYILVSVNDTVPIDR